MNTHTHEIDSEYFCLKEEPLKINYLFGSTSPFYFDINYCIQGNKKYYWFNSENFEIGIEYRILSCQLYIPKEFNFTEFGEFNFIFLKKEDDTETSKLNKSKKKEKSKITIKMPPECHKFCVYKTSWIRQDLKGTLGHINNKIEAFHYKEHFFLPMFVVDDCTRKYYFAYYKISINRYNFFSILASKNKINTNTQWVAHDDYENMNFNGDIYIKIFKEMDYVI